MPAIQTLKKQLRGIRSTQKLTKAMNTVSTVKFSKLNGLYGSFAPYGAACRALAEQYGPALAEAAPAADPNAPTLFVVMASNKGLCGSFNAEVLHFAQAKLSEEPRCHLIACGKKAVSFFKTKQIPLKKEHIFSDIPTYEESSVLLDEILALRAAGEISDVQIIYPQYRHMMIQIPAVCPLFENEGSENDLLCLPDRETVIGEAATVVFRSVFYRTVLETALGAQAATLLTMRAAYDTATDFCAHLEGQINRKRQSAVTADVIETSAEWQE